MPSTSQSSYRRVTEDPESPPEDSEVKEEVPEVPFNERVEKQMESDQDYMWKKGMCAIGVALIIPAAKLVVTGVILLVLISDERIEPELKFPSKDVPISKGEIFFLYTILTVFVSLITLLWGTPILSHYPSVKPISLNSYLVYRVLVIVLEISAWIPCWKNYDFTAWEHFSVDVTMGLDVISIIPLKIFYMQCRRKQLQKEEIAATEIELKLMSAAEEA